MAKRGDGGSFMGASVRFGEVVPREGVSEHNVHKLMGDDVVETFGESRTLDFDWFGSVTLDSSKFENKSLVRSNGRV